jgi:hypothetical protein
MRVTIVPSIAIAIIIVSIVITITTIISIIVIIISRVVVFVVIIVVIVINIISGSSAVLSGPRLDKGWQGLQGSCCALLAWRAFTTCVHWD